VLICPSCDSHRVFAKVGCTSCQSTNIEYSEHATRFKCAVCNNIMSLPEHSYTCENCGKSLNEKQLNIKKIYSFIVTVEGRTLVDNWVMDLDNMLESAREFYRNTHPISASPFRYQNPDNWRKESVSNLES
jgi:ribosomal protein S27E